MYEKTSSDHQVAGASGQLKTLIGARVTCLKRKILISRWIEVVLE
jgi:hypothetical protein